jgi:dihydropyrimidinase
MESYDLIIKNGIVVTPSEEFVADIGICQGKVTDISQELLNGKNVIDAKGKYVIPGGVDIHTHIDAPLHGSNTMDDWYEATCSAAYGGVTCVVDYPIQEEGQTLRDVISNSMKKAEDKSILDYSFSPVITRRTDEGYKEIAELIKEGFTTYKVFMAYSFRARDEELIKLLDVISSNGGILGVHAENDWAIEYMANKMISEGKTEPIYHCLSRPPVTEEEATGRVIRLAEMVKAPVLIVHVSAKGALEEIENARRRGNPVYGETCPHFLTLDQDLYNQPVEEAAKYVVTPPLRKNEHRLALWSGLSSGALSLVSSDHCAFSLKEKLRLGSGAFNKIPHGAPGIETRLPILFSEGVVKKRITINKFVELVSTNPAKIAGLYPSKGTISIGSDADITIIDPEKEMKISTAKLHSVCDFTPFEGFIVKGIPSVVIKGGKVIVSGDELFAIPGDGNHIKRNSFKAF